MLYGVCKDLLASVLFMLYIHFCHCKQLNHQEYMGYVYKAVLAQIYTWDFVQPVPLLAHQEATPTGLVAVPPQHFRELLPSSPVEQGCLTCMTTKLYLSLSCQLSEGMGGMFSRPWEWFEGPLQGKAFRTEGLAPQETRGRNCWSQTGCVMERDQQALAENPAKDRDHLHSCASRPCWLPEAQQEGLQTPQPQAVCGEQGGKGKEALRSPDTPASAAQASAHSCVYYAQYTSKDQRK